ncbi:glucokinase [Desulfitispora alkaliphila]|uniref:ROK family protein n=1 Tax=Desulfitispora alkaliphila TaxID=622674 RepID=UPI003D1B191F
MKALEQAVGVDIGGTNIKLALVDSNGSILNKAVMETGNAWERSSFYLKLYNKIAEILKPESSWQHIIGVGIGVPGLVDSARGHVFYAPNLRWDGIDLKRELADHIPTSIRIGNDANVATLGEAWMGAGVGEENIVMITLGTGVGSGVLINGQLYTGQGVGTEIGHMVIDSKGPKCVCGSRGCFETLVSAKAIATRATEIIGEQISKKELKKVFASAKKGDANATRVVNETATYLGIGIANIINIFNPSKLIIGGGISMAGNVLIEPAVEVAKEYSLKAALERVTVVRAQLGNDAGVIGAGGLFLRGESNDKN